MEGTMNIGAVGKNIRFWRKQRGMTQAQLADKVGLTRQQVYRIEAGIQGTTMARLDAIAEALGVSRTVLLEGGAPQLALAVPPRVEKILTTKRYIMVPVEESWYESGIPPEALAEIVKGIYAAFWRAGQGDTS